MKTYASDVIGMFRVPPRAAYQSWNKTRFAIIRIIVAMVSAIGAKLLWNELSAQPMVALPTVLALIGGAFLLVCFDIVLVLALSRLYEKLVPPPAR